MEKKYNFDVKPGEYGINIDDKVTKEVNNYFSSSDVEGEDKVQSVPIKDTIGYWTDKQIAENPEAYIKYLKELLNGAIARADKESIERINFEISEIYQRFFSYPDDFSKGRGR